MAVAHSQRLDDNQGAQPPASRRHVGSLSDADRVTERDTWQAGIPLPATETTSGSTQRGLDTDAECDDHRHGHGHPQTRVQRTRHTPQWQIHTLACKGL